jgi:hypothetical protein
MPFRKPFSIITLFFSVLLHPLAGNAASSTINGTPSEVGSDTAMNSLTHAADTQSKRPPATTRTIPTETQDDYRWPSIPGLGLGPIKPAPIRPVLIPPPEPRDIMLINDSGFRSTESILRIIRQHIGGFRYSHEKALREHPRVHGDILLEFTIAPSGDIVALHVVRSTTKSPSLDDDIKEKARRMKFDVIERGNATVQYKLRLRAKEASPKKPHKPTRPPM